MPRARRLKSETGIYHVVLRGINRQTIFEDDEDREMFLLRVFQCKKQSGFKLLAFCLMDNHVHLLMKTENESLSQVFKRIGASYVYWYNRKYDRSGHLFQDRFKSEAVETDGYLFGVLRYIHQNPLKAGMVKKLEDYIWSSYPEYIGLSENRNVDKEFVLALFHQDLKQAVVDFKNFNEMMSDQVFLDISDKKSMSDQRAISLIKKKYAINSPTDIQGFDPADRDKCIRFLLKKGLSARQVSRITGISRYSVKKQV